MPGPNDWPGTVLRLRGIVKQAGLDRTTSPAYSMDNGSCEECGGLSNGYGFTTDLFWENCSYCFSGAYDQT